MPEGWVKNLDRLQQKVLDARWVKKNGINHYAYNNNIWIDVEHGFIRLYAVTPANIHDSQMLPLLLDPENSDDYVRHIQPMQASALKTYWIFAVLKVAFTKKAAAITR